MRRAPSWGLCLRASPPAWSVSRCCSERCCKLVERLKILIKFHTLEEVFSWNINLGFFNVIQIIFQFVSLFFSKLRISWVIEVDLFYLNHLPELLELERLLAQFLVVLPEHCREHVAGIGLGDWGQGLQDVAAHGRWQQRVDRDWTIEFNRCS